MRHFLYFLLSLSVFTCQAQEIHLARIQDLDFGKFYLTGVGEGRITVHNDGTWNAEGNIRHLDILPKPAIFTIWTESLKPIKIRLEIVYTKLSNSNGPMGLRIKNEEKIDYHMVSHNSPLQIMVGGVLSIEPTGSGPGTFQGQVMVRANKVPF